MSQFYLVEKEMSDGCKVYGIADSENEGYEEAVVDVGSKGDALAVLEVFNKHVCSIEPHPNGFGSCQGSWRRVQ